MKRNRFKKWTLLFLGAAACLGTASAHVREFEIKGDQPVTSWIHAYPVGNGRLGAMPYGKYPNEQILLNDETVWSGRNFEENSMESMYIIDDIRNLLWQGKYREAQKKTAEDFLANELSPRSYQPLGFLKLKYLNGKSASLRNYRRMLSLNRAVASEEFETEDGYHIRQEVFSSHPDDVIVVHIQSLNRKKLSLRADMERYAGDEVNTIGENALVLSGQAKNERPGGEQNKGVCFHAVVKVLSDGEVRAEDGGIRIDDAGDLVFLIASATDYNKANPYIPLRKDREKECLQTITAAERVGFAQLLERHIADHRSYFERASVDLGTTPESVLKKTTDERLELVRHGGEDPDLVEDLFQMGRYMLIASSRKGTLPPNLMGIWNGTPLPKCDSDWHTNINVQENYWHAEVTNLSDLHEPLITLVDDIRKNQGKYMASKLGCRGFVISHTTHGWKQAVFSGHPFWGMWPMGGAWCCSHVMEHYRFTADKDYLKNTAYPILRDNILFCMDWLTENPETGELVSGPSTSPENGFYVDDSKEIINVCMGPTIDRQIIYESFTDFLEASEVLGISNNLTKEVSDARSRLAKTEIAPDGRIMEWDKNYREWQVNHRHYSHLYALYPGCEITPETPELFQAAQKSIEMRQVNGGCREGWSRAWLVNFYARLRQKEKAYDAMMFLLKKHTMPNLLHTEIALNRSHFVDGNGAGTSGIAEMLLQSQGPQHIIRLLPCLPKAWNTGSFEGLCARGAFEINLTWKDGKAREAQVISKAGNPFRLACDGGVRISCNGKEIAAEQKGDILTFDTQKGKVYRITFH